MAFNLNITVEYMDNGVRKSCAVDTGTYLFNQHFSEVEATKISTTHHESQQIFTAATVGGITTGGISETKAYNSVKSTGSTGNSWLLFYHDELKEKADGTHELVNTHYFCCSIKFNQKLADLYKETAPSSIKYLLSDDNEIILFKPVTDNSIAFSYQGYLYNTDAAYNRLVETMLPTYIVKDLKDYLNSLIDGTGLPNEYKYRLVNSVLDDSNCTKENVRWASYMISRVETVEAKELRRKLEEKKKSAGGCYIATCVYGSYDCPEVWSLRRFRDNVLAESWYGRAFIRVYYAVSPTVVKLFGKSKVFRNSWKKYLDKKVSKLKNLGFEDTPYDDKMW